MNNKTVTGSDIIEKYGEQSVSVESLTALQQAGIKIAVGVGIVSVLVIIGLGLQWSLQAPEMPILPHNPTDQQITSFKNILDYYKTASELALSGPKELFDIIIVKILYPLFTLILGYVFGTRAKDIDNG